MLLTLICDDPGRSPEFAKIWQVHTDPQIYWCVFYAQYILIMLLTPILKTWLTVVGNKGPYPDLFWVLALLLMFLN